MINRHIACMHGSVTIWVPRDEDSDELLSELEWASQRPCSTWSQTEQGNTVPPLDDATSFFSSLTECEQKFLSCYEIKMPNGLYSLNQNPEVTNMGTNGKARYCKTTMSYGYWRFCSTQLMLFVITATWGPVWWLCFRNCNEPTYVLGFPTENITKHNFWNEP